MSERKISIAIPTYQRFEMLFESFEKACEDERVSEIVIVDDCSDKELFEKIRERCFNIPKIKLHRNIQNRDCYQNKYTAVSFATNEWVILLDSDNIIGKDYIDKIFSFEWDTNTIYTPEFAWPHFDFRAYSGLMVSKENVSEYVNKPHFETMLNAANYFVNRDFYLKVFDGSVDPVTSDSIFQCYNWLAAGNKIKVVEGLQYYHRVHRGHYQENVSRTTPGFHEGVLQKLRELK